VSGPSEDVIVKVLKVVIQCTAKLPPLGPTMREVVNMLDWFWSLRLSQRRRIMVSICWFFLLGSVTLYYDNLGEIGSLCISLRAINWGTTTRLHHYYQLLFILASQWTRLWAKYLSWYCSVYGGPSSLLQFGRHMPFLCIHFCGCYPEILSS